MAEKYAEGSENSSDANERQVTEQFISNQTTSSSSQYLFDPSHSEIFSQHTAYSVNSSLNSLSTSSAGPGDETGHLTALDELDGIQLMELASKIIIPDYDYPPEYREPHYDILLMYTEEDEKYARAFQYVVQTCIVLKDGRPPKICLLDPTCITHKSSRFAHMGEAIERSTYMFMLITERFCTDSWAEIQRDECLMESINNPAKRWCVIPIHTQTKLEKTLQLPFGLRSLKGVSMVKMFRRSDLTVDICGGSHPPKLDPSCDIDGHFLNGMTRMLNDRIGLKLDREKQAEKELQKWIKEERVKRFIKRRDEELLHQLENLDYMRRLTSSQKEPFQKAEMSKIDTHSTRDGSHMSVRRPRVDPPRPYPDGGHSGSSEYPQQQAVEVHHHYHYGQSDATTLPPAQNTVVYNIYGPVTQSQIGNDNTMNTKQVAPNEGQDTGSSSCPGSDDAGIDAPPEESSEELEDYVIVPDVVRRRQSGHDRRASPPSTEKPLRNAPSPHPVWDPSLPSQQKHHHHHQQQQPQRQQLRQSTSNNICSAVPLSHSSQESDAAPNTASLKQHKLEAAPVTETQFGASSLRPVVTVKPFVQQQPSREVTPTRADDETKPMIVANASFLNNETAVKEVVDIDDTDPKELFQNNANISSVAANAIRFDCGQSSVRMDASDFANTSLSTSDTANNRSAPNSLHFTEISPTRQPRVEKIGSSSNGLSVSMSAVPTAPSRHPFFHSNSATEISSSAPSSQQRSAVRPQKPRNRECPLS